jgi:hypothetical protein
MTDAPYDTQEVENPAEVLRNQDGVFEVTSPYGYVFQVTCRPGTQMGICQIDEPKSARVTEGTRWRIRRMNHAVA